MNFAALLSAYDLIKRFFPVIKTVATMIDAELPDSPGKVKAEAAFAMLGHVSDEFKTVSPELQIAFNGAISVYKLITHGAAAQPAAA